jgi:hypothetical protein
MIIGSILFILVLVFLYNGFCTRCPNCGYWGLNKKTKEDEFSKFDKEYQKAMRQLSKNDTILKKINSKSSESFTSRLLMCKKCGHEFNRKLAHEWNNVSKKVGNMKAIEIYKNNI